jgi:hypothetical protein
MGTHGHAFDSPLLCTRTHEPVGYFQANYVFKWLRTVAGIMRFERGRSQPRLRDFRQHAFAVSQIVVRLM